MCCPTHEPLLCMEPPDSYGYCRSTSHIIETSTFRHCPSWSRAVSVSENCAALQKIELSKRFEENRFKLFIYFLFSTKPSLGEKSFLLSFRLLYAIYCFTDIVYCSNLIGQTANCLVFLGGCVGINQQIIIKYSNMIMRDN